MYLRPKDSNAAVGVRDRATGKALEGADRQTNRRSVHYSKMTNKLCSVCNYFVFVSDLQYFLIWLHTLLGLLITILEP